MVDLGKRKLKSTKSKDWKEKDKNTKDSKCCKMLKGIKTSNQCNLSSSSTKTRNKAKQ